MAFLPSSLPGMLVIKILVKARNCFLNQTNFQKIISIENLFKMENQVVNNIRRISQQIVIMHNNGNLSSRMYSIRNLVEVGSVFVSLLAPPDIGFFMPTLLLHL